MSAMKFHGKFMKTSCSSHYVARVFFMACDSQMVFEFIPYSLEWNETYSNESSPIDTGEVQGTRILYGG